MRLPRIQRPRLSYANVVATFALVLATSTGGAYAHGMIGSDDLERNAVKGRHIDRGAVKSSDIKRHNVKSSDLKRKSVTKGKLAENARTIAWGASGPYAETTGDGDTVTLVTKTIDVPAKGYLHVTGSTLGNDGPATGTGDADLEVNLDGRSIIAAVMNYPTTGIKSATATRSTVVPVTRGTHTVSVHALEFGTGSEFYGPTLAILYTPYGSAPATPPVVVNKVPARR